jgi:hypothetical protein
VFLYCLPALSLSHSSFFCILKELPEELQRKIRRARLDEEKLNQHFDVLCNVIRFVTKKTIVKDQNNPEKKKTEKKDQSESNVVEPILESASKTKTQQDEKRRGKETTTTTTMEI